MTESSPWSLKANTREAGALCPQCEIEIELGDKVAQCRECGTAHHWNCWEENNGCRAYECAPENRKSLSEKPEIRITADDLGAAVPVAPASQTQVVYDAIPTKTATQRQTATSRGSADKINPWSIVALVLALLGIPLLGVPGLIAVIVAVGALATRDRYRRGTVMAAISIVLGLATTVGWAIVVGSGLIWFSTAAPERSGASIEDLQPNLASFDTYKPHISRALRANVVVEISTGWASGGLGSGVILEIKDNQALIVTNRHVIDPEFDDKEGVATTTATNRKLRVKLVGQPIQQAAVKWIAPGGIDLALISVKVLSQEVQTARWQENPRLPIGADVFAIGNPHGLSWSYTSGKISQVRLDRRGGGREIRIIQTSTPINSGNSGGGLYDDDGILIGIVTWTNDKRFAEGLSFAISFQTLIDLVPRNLKPTSATEESELP